jgi:hypothetical protein
MRLLKENITKTVYKSLLEDFNLPTDDDIEAEVEKYRTSQMDKITKHEQDDEVKHQEMLNYFKQQKRDYMKNRKDSLKKYRADNEPTEERLNAKREELRQKREKDREDYQRWFNETKEKKAKYFSDVNALTDLRDMENPGDFKYGGFNVCFTYNGKSYWVGWYDSDVYLPFDSRDGYYQWEYGYEIPNSDVHKWKKEIKPIRSMSPEEFGLEVKPGSKNRVKGIIDLSKLGGGSSEPRETSNEAIAKTLDSLGESASSTMNFIQELNKYREEYSYGHSDNDSYIKERVLDLLNSLPVGSSFYKNYKETVSGYTSFGGYDHEYARIIEYRKDEDGWKEDGMSTTVEDVLLGVLHSSSEIRTKEEAEKAQGEMKKGLKSTHTPYAPKSNVDKDNPYWDGNKYGI